MRDRTESYNHLYKKALMGVEKLYRRIDQSKIITDDN